MKILKFLEKHIEEIIVVSALAIMSLVISLQVFMRYVMQSSLSWSEELARYLFILLVYAGISYGVKKRKHICVEAFTMWMPRKGQMVIELISDFLFLFFSVIIVIYGYQMAMKIYSLGQVSAALKLPMGLVYMSLPFSYILTTIRLIQNIVWRIEVLMGRKTEEEEA